MGSFKHPMELLSQDGQRVEQTEAWVDTGAFYTWIPVPILEGLGYRPSSLRTFVMADGRTVQRPMGEVTIRLNRETLHTLCIFGDPDSSPLLGAVTMEEFGLGVDPVNKRLVPVTLPLL